VQFAVKVLIRYKQSLSQIKKPPEKRVAFLFSDYRRFQSDQLSRE
jgi:hypothetical protein